MKDFGVRTQKKNFIWWCVPVMAILLGLGLFWCKTQATAEGVGYRTIAVIETSGAVTVVKGDLEYSAYPGMLLQEGHVLVTAGGGSVRLVLDGDKYVKVESGSRVIFETLGLLGSGKTTLRLERGALTSEIVKPLKDGEEFVVNTPNAVLAVRGTFFRVELETARSGEIKANVLTYGGRVATKRVFPSGEIEETEALVEAGFKTAINMDKDTTVYVVEKTEEAVDTTGDGTLNAEPIETADISDEDLIDMYHSSENGHELFVTTEELKEDIVARNIDIQATTSVYEKASSVSGETVSPVADDSTPMVMAEETKPIEDTEEGNTPEKEETAKEEAPAIGFLTDGAFEIKENVALHTHTEKEERVEPTCMQAGYQVISCMECGEEISRLDLPALEHEVKINRVEPTCTEHGAQTETCTVCGKVLAESMLAAKGHVSSVEMTAATCTEDGVETEICTVCGEILSETVIEATGHIGSVETIEPTCTQTGMETETCTVCGEILSENVLGAKGHTSSVSRVEATCETEGYERITCSDCGILLSQSTLPIGDHRPEFVGDELVHSRCADCGITLETEHVYSDTVMQGLTCTRDGITLKECECGHTYEHVMTASGHVRDLNNDTRCSECGELWASLDDVTFPDAAFLAYVSQYDSDADGHLWASELSGVSTLNLAGTSTQDGGYSDLTGIKYFANLTTLNCAYNAGITELYLQNNNSLETITCYNTGLAYLQVSDAGTLRSLNVFACPIQELLLADQTSLTTLNVGNCDSLAMIDISNTAVATLDVSSVENLAWLDVSGTPLTVLDVTNLSQMVSLDVSECRTLGTLSAEACNLLGEVYLTDCTALTNVSLIGCSSLEGVDFSGCTMLYELNVSEAGLISLDVSGLTSLYNLGGEDCTGLTSVNASGCTMLYSASFARNTQLSTINVSGNTNMYELRLTGCTGLTSVNVTSCGSGTSNFVIYATGTGKASSFFTGYDSGYMMFQGD